MSFPVGVHDDQVDALGLVGQLLDRMGWATCPRTRRKSDEGGASRRAPLSWLMA
jgi:hypothetical protein